MDLKQQFQQDLLDALRRQDRQRVNVLRILLDEFDNAQKNLGIQAFETINLHETNILPDRQQILRKQAIQDILNKELIRRQEFIDLMITSGKKERAEGEEMEIAILKEYLKLF